MKTVVLSVEGKKSICYRLVDLPFSDAELDKHVLQYYRKATCKRCRNAVLQVMLNHLLSELETGELSDETFRLFPILSKYTMIRITED